jgi:hypothetical protein
MRRRHRERNAECHRADRFDLDARGSTAVGRELPLQCAEVERAHRRRYVATEADLQRATLAGNWRDRIGLGQHPVGRRRFRQHDPHRWRVRAEQQCRLGLRQRGRPVFGRRHRRHRR